MRLGLIANGLTCTVVSSFTEKPSVKSILSSHGIWNKTIAEIVSLNSVNNKEGIQA